MKNRQSFVNKSSWQIGLVLLLTVFFLGLVISSCNQRRGSHSRNGNLLYSDLMFKLPQDSEQQFISFVKENKLDKTIKRVNLNFFKPQNNWTGVVRKGGECYHAAFSVNNSRIIAELEKQASDKLHFAIYNPAESKLSYNIYFNIKGVTEQIFSRSYKQERYEEFNLVVPDPGQKKWSVIFETRGLGVGCWVNPVLSQNRKDPKTFVIVVLDTLRYDHTSLYGYHRKTTPLLDELATDSEIYKNAFTTTSWTYPAHVSLFSGKDLLEHGIAAPGVPISGSYPLISELFLKNDYLTAAFTGGGFINDRLGFYRGFQTYSNNPGSIFIKSSANKVLEYFKAFMERFRGNDIFLFLHTYQIHTPYNNIPKGYMKTFNKNINPRLRGYSSFSKNKFVEYFKPLNEEKRLELIDMYDAGIYFSDRVLIGGIVKYLKQNKLYDNACLVITSDHGEEFFDHGSWEHGHALYKEQIQIPLVIKHRQQIRVGENHQLASIKDIPNLMISAAGFKEDTHHFSTGFGQHNRTLTILLPVSPLIKQIPAKISFLNSDFHFIHNLIRKKDLLFFDPAPLNLKIYELYSANDSRQLKNIYDESAGQKKYFNSLLKNSMKRIKKLQLKKGEIAKDLVEKLKSLGYLGN